MARASDGSGNSLPAHPRLLIREPAWQAIVRNHAEGKLPAGLLDSIHHSAAGLLESKPSERVVKGRRLLDVSREVARRVAHLSFAHRTGGPEGCARRAVAEMLAAAEFIDWNPSHFLDTAEMTAALAVGYDWLSGAMSEEERQTVANAIKSKGLQPALQVARGKGGFPRSRNNWNQVCWGGILLGALAIGDREPAIMRELLDHARATMGAGLAPLEPDGVYPEGPGYWDYGSIYQTLSIEALRSALGDDGGIAGHRAWLASADFYLHSSGPDGAFFNFADCGCGHASSPVMVWMAVEKKNASYLFHNKRRMADFRQGRGAPGPWDILLAHWWPLAAAMPARPMPAHWHGRGPNPVAFWRSSWDDPAGVYLAIKAGGARVSHGHMDAGSFVLDAMGVRWAREIRAEPYHRLESMGVNLWSFKQSSDRWKLFRLNQDGHNTLVVGREPHRADQLATLEKADAKGATIDFAKTLGPDCASARREVAWAGDRINLIDTIQTTKAGTSVRWAMNTTADATVDGQRVILREKGKTLFLDFDLPGGSSIEIVSVEQPGGEWDSPNPGYRQVRVHASAPEKSPCVIRTTFSGW